MRIKRNKIDVKRSVPFSGPTVTTPDPCISDNIPNHRRICTSVV